MSFTIYNVEEDDIYNQYAVGNTTNTNQPNNCVFNLITIEGVNDLQILNKEGETGVLIGYTPASNVVISNQAQFFLLTDDIPADDNTLIFTNPNIARLPGNAIINSITAINVKGGPIPTDIISQAGVFACQSGFINVINVIGNFTSSPEELLPLSDFNNLVIGSEITEILDETYVFIYGPNNLVAPYDQYQLQLTVNYTLV